MAETTIKNPIGRSVIWEEFKKQHPNLPEFTNIGEFLSWAIKQNPPIQNPYGLWEARLDFIASESVTEEKEQSTEDKPVKEKVKKDKHEEFESPIGNEEIEKEEDQKKDEVKPSETPTQSPVQEAQPAAKDSWGTEEKIGYTTAIKTQDDINFPQSPPPEEIISDQKDEPTIDEIKPNINKEVGKIGDDNWGTPEPLSPSGQVQNSFEQWRESASVDRPTRQAARYVPSPRILKPKIPSVAKASGVASKAKNVSWLVRIPYAIPVIAVVIIIVLLILVPVIIIGKASEDPIFAVQVGLNPFFANNSNQPSVAPTLPPAGGGDTAKCNTNPRDCLKNEFNFEVRGNASTGQMNDVFNLLSEVTVAPEYRRLLRSSGPTEVEFVNDSSKGGGCPARVQPIGNGRSRLTLYNYPNTCDRQERKSRLVHESGHILRNGHMRLFDKFENEAYNKDRGCYYRETEFSPSFFINTYSTSFASGQGVNISGSNESMAEFMALHVIPDGAYPRKCPVGYNWVINNIFGNYRF